MSPPDFPNQLGPYTPQRLLGRGAMAAVYLCRTPLDQPVAVKWLDQPHPPLVRRFETEIRVLERIRHPGVVQYIDHGVWDGRPYLVMEYIDGTDLRDYAPKLHQRPPSERYMRCRAIGRNIADALAYLHDNSIIHRDIKPSNVLIDAEGRAILADFGVVKEEDAYHADQTSVGQMIGTISYAAPEQLRCERVDPRADLFGLGATLYYTLTLRRPYEGMERKDTDQPPTPSRVDPNIPVGLETAIMQMLSTEPRNRYADAREVVRVLSTGASTGMLLAGQQRLLKQVQTCLDRVQHGEVVLVQPVGVPGTNRDWLVETFRHGARRRGLPLWQPSDGLASLHRQTGGMLGVLSATDTAPAGWSVTTVETLPLGIADVRRSLVAIAPKTPDSAQAAEHLHRLTGGLPALLIPLLSQHTHQDCFSPPKELPEPDAVDDFFDGLDLDELDVLAALAALDQPATATDLEALAMVPAEDALRAPLQRGIVRCIGSEWVFSAMLFSFAALARSPDPDGLLQQADTLLRSRQSPKTAAVAPQPNIDALVDDGQLAAALQQARQLATHAAGHGDRAAECRALCVLGQVLLDLGLVAEAGRRLADATALAKAASLTEERQLSHALRARASLESKPGRRSAAAAVDRLLPLVTGARSRQPLPTDALVYGIWAYASGMLGDARAFQRAQDRAMAAADHTAPRMKHRMLLSVAKGAAALGRPAVALSLLTTLDSALQTEAMLIWEVGRLRAALSDAAPPPTSPIAYGLAPDALAALKRRTFFIDGRLWDVSSH